MNLSNKGLIEIPTISGNVDDYFNCSNNKLTSLKGSPNEVSGYFSCSNNELTSLIGSPKKVGGYYSCSYNHLTNLKGSPNEIKGDYTCMHNLLTDLNGSPNYVGGSINCYDNNLISLFGVPKIIKYLFDFRNNRKLFDISDIWDSDIGNVIYFDFTLTMALLPLIKFYMLRSGDPMIDSIHKRNCGNSKQNIINFQYELIENGFEDNARWKP